MLCPLDHAAGDFSAGVAGGLGMKIVWHIVDHYRPAEDIADTEAAGGYCQVGVAVAVHQRRKIPGVVGVGRFGGVIVAEGVGKVCAGAAVACVDMKPEEASVGFGQAADGGLHQHTVPALIESHLPAQVGIVL